MRDEAPFGRIRFRLRSSVRGLSGGRALLACALVGLGVAALVTAGLGGPRPEVHRHAALGPDTTGTFLDTVAVFGPKRFEAAGGQPQLYIEEFAIEALPGTRYTLIVRNGAVDGSARVARATIRLNGTELVHAREWSRRTGELRRAVALDASNTLGVTLEGQPGTHVTMSIVRTPDPTFTVFGPARYERDREQPRWSSERFAISPTAAPPYTLQVVNGNPDATDRVASARVRLNGRDALTPRDFDPQVRRLARDVTLAGENKLQVLVEGEPGSHLTLRLTATDTTPPLLRITRPEARLITNTMQLEVTGEVRDQTHTRVRVNGETASLNGTAFRAIVPLDVEGENTLRVTAVDAAGLRTDSLQTVIRDTRAPIIAWSRPAAGLITNDSTVRLRGTIRDLTPVSARANGLPLVVEGPSEFTGTEETSRFSGVVPLGIEGENVITLTVTDAATNTAMAVRRVIRDTRPPVLTVATPKDGAIVEADSVEVRGTVDDLTQTSVVVNGTEAAVAENGGFRAVVALAVGENALTLTASDAAGNTATLTLTVTRESAGEQLPPDPSEVAPPIDPTVATTVAASTEFLYTGENPIQRDVAPGTIEPVRAAVVRGRVLTRAGEPLAGVKVTVSGHPELGYTLSREVGRYDLAVNGGGELTLHFDKDGYLPAERPVEPGWQDWATVEDVRLVTLDPRVTEIDLSGADEIQVARSSVIEDADGPRQATMLFAPGTEAVMRMPDGSTQQVSSLHIRATEYTVGEGGREAMPAPLPPTVAYTYAVELSADEALAAGAEHVRFSEPVAFYVENFLGFPVGIPVPAAYYAEGKNGCGWVPMENGAVIEVLGSQDGLAQIDADGDGVADTQASLSALGIAIAERQRLASLYAPGETLWRVEVEHFSAIDLNYPSGPPAGAVRPPSDPPETDTPENTPCTQAGSIIACENQVVGERIQIAGTSLTLNYRSGRVPGRTVAYELKIPLSGDNVPENLRRILLEVRVAGQVFRDTFPAEPNLHTTFTWDGRDAYGRRVRGNRKMEVRVGYVYPFTYRVPASTARSFGLACTGSERWRNCVIPQSVNADARQNGVLWQEWSPTLGAWDARSQGLGGWTLGIHHAYEPVDRVLYLGDGTRRSTSGLRATIRTIAGTGLNTSSGDGGPAIEASMRDMAGIAVGPDGSIYVAETNGHRIRKIGPNGIITTIAGTGMAGFSGDGGPATQAQLNHPFDVAVGPNGDIYIADRDNQRIRRVAASTGIITTVAGNGSYGFSGDGGPATEASLARPEGVIVGPDCSIYIVDQDNDRIRKVSPDGIITTIAGGGNWWEGLGDGGLATEAYLARPLKAALGPDGSLYIADYRNNRIRRVTPDGMITTVAGTGDYGFSGDGGPATLADLRLPGSVAVGADGTIYIADRGNYRIRAVSPNGIIRTIAGSGERGFSGDGGPATAAKLSVVFDLAIGPVGNVYLADTSNRRIRKIVPVLPGGTPGNVIIASEDGARFYHFGATGRHLETRDSRTGAVLYRFLYNDAGLLTGIVDADGLTTTIERASDGTPLAIVAPHGQRTELEVNANGYLASVTNPAGETVTVSYHQGGLLATLTDPNGNTHHFSYSRDGRLVRDENPAGGSKTLVRTELENGYEVSISTQLDRTTTYRVEEFATGDKLRSVTTPAGLTTTTTIRRDGSRTMTAPNGTETTVVRGPDPRFGMQAPITQKLTITSPGGLTSRTTTTRSVQLADPADPLTLLTLTDSVTVNGRVTVSRYFAASGERTTTSPEGRTSRALLDSVGRVLRAEVPGVLPVKNTYDNEGRLVRTVQGARVLRYTYNAEGYLASVTDPLGRTTEFFYGGAGRITRRVLPGGREITYTYDANGNLTSLTPPGRPAHVFEHTPMDQRKAYVPPEVVGNATTTRYTYNLDGDLTQIIRPGGETVRFRYDDAGRLSTVMLPRGEVSYAYDQDTGNLARLTAPDGGTLSYAYDGSLRTSTQWAGAVSGSVGVTYNNNFWITSRTVNDGQTAHFIYDRDGLLTGADALQLTRDAETGRIGGTTLSSVATSHSYNDFGELASTTATAGGSMLYEAQYTRDKLGRITSRTETIAGTTITWGYTYDTAGRLTTVTRNGAPYASYEYDANGNRLRRVSSAGVLTGTYDAQDRLLSYGAASYGYTQAGELRYKAVGADTTWYRYDAVGNLLGVRLPDGTEIDYIIDARNRRVGKRVNGALVWGLLHKDGLNPVAMLDAAGNVTARFVYGARANTPAYMIKNGRTYRYVTDQLGSVRLVVDVETGEIAQRIDYDAFGQITRNTNPGFQPFGFAGGLVDRHTGLVRFGARDYDSHVGRWTAKDPILFAGGSANLYGYVLQDPVNLVDPTGQITVISAVVAVAVIGWAAYEAYGIVTDFYDAYQTAAGLAGTRRRAAIAKRRWRRAVELGNVELARDAYLDYRNAVKDAAVAGGKLATKACMFQWGHLSGMASY